MIFTFLFFIQMIIYSRIHLELAFFNDHILAWEPFIEPIVNERGEIVSPWYITCLTRTVSRRKIFLMTELSEILFFFYNRKKMKMKMR